MKYSARFSVRLSMLALIAAPVMGFAAATVEQLAAYLPADSEAIVGLNLKAFDRTDSLLSVVTLSEIEAKLNEQAAAEGSDLSKMLSENAASAAMGIALLRSKSELKTDTMLLGLSELSGDEPAISSVLSGAYPENAGEKLAGLGFAKAGETKHLVVADAANAEQAVYLANPSQEFLVMRSAVAALDGLSTASDTTTFTKSSSALGAETWDAFVYIAGSSLRRMSEQSPEAKAMAGPVLKADGVLLSLKSGATPTVELTFNYATEMDAQIGSEFLKTMLGMGRAQMEQFSQMPLDDTQKAEITRTLAMIDAVVISAESSTTVARLPLTDLPSREEIKKQVMDSLNGMTSGASLPF